VRIKILLVEDERKLARVIGRQLTRASYEVDIVHDGQSAINNILSEEYHIIVLDLNIPNKSGTDVIHEIRSKSYLTPILIISARDTLKDRVNGLEIGADDYLTKPFDSSELIARIQAILRRSGTLRTAILKARDLSMDMVKRTVSRGEKCISLSQTEFSLLEFFLRNKNTILTRRRIAEQVWGYKFETGTNIVDVYVSYLRDSIDKEFPTKLIETVRGEGFILKDS
jgi:two-component system, OmpR family, copper resistance phosphate regulon response regulator CusR